MTSIIDLIEMKLVLDSVDTNEEILLSDIENHDLTAVIDSKKYTITPDGYLIVDAIVSKAGVYTYAGIGEVAKLPNDLYSKPSLDALRGLEIVVEHPPTATKLLDSSTAKYYTVGHSISDAVVTDSGIVLTLKITDKDAVKAVLEGGKKYISLGSKANWIIGEGVFDSKNYQLKQVNFRHNHIALTSNPRVSSSVIMLDSLDKKNNKKGDKKMPVVQLGKNISVEVDEKTAVVLDSFINQTNQTLTGLETEKSSLSKTVGELEGKIAVLDSKEDVENKIKAGVKARLELVSKVSKIAKNIVLDSDDDKVIMVNAIKEAKPNFVISRPDDAGYLSGVLDSLIADKEATVSGKQGNDLDVRKLAGFDLNNKPSLDSNIDPVEEARKKMIERTNNSWKGGKK